MSERSKIEGLLNDIISYQSQINTRLSSGISASIDLVGKQAARIIFVDSMAAAGGNGLTRATAFRTIQEGLDLADVTNTADLILIFDDPGGDGYDINRNDVGATWDSPVIIIGVGRGQVRIVNDFVGASHVMKFEDAVYIENISIIVDDSIVQDGIVIEGGHADGSEIKNCDFDFLNAGDDSKCIVLHEIERVRIERCHFYIHGEEAQVIIGVEVNEGLRCEIRDSIFAGSHPSVVGGTGVKFSTSGGACRQNYLMDNFFYLCDNGVDIDANCNYNGVLRSYFKSCTADVTDNGTDNYEMGSTTAA